MGADRLYRAAKADHEGGVETAPADRHVSHEDQRFTHLDDRLQASTASSEVEPLAQAVRTDRGHDHVAGFEVVVTAGDHEPPAGVAAHDVQPKTPVLKIDPVGVVVGLLIHDHDGFGGVEIAEYASIGKVVQIADFLRARGRLGALVLEQLDGDLDSAAIALEDQYCGVFASLADYFQDLTEETTQVPEHLRLYIDYVAMAYDARAGGEVFTVETAHDQVHVFRTR